VREIGDIGDIPDNRFGPSITSATPRRYSTLNRKAQEAEKQSFGDRQMKIASFPNRPQTVGIIIIMGAVLAVSWYAAKTPATSSIANKLRGFMGLPTLS
jgi:hypothetical protein